MHLRPGLVAAMLDFYDELRRRGRTVRRFGDVLDEELAGYQDADDRGTVELARQTAFLRATFEEYERAVSSSGVVDEHGVRDRLLAGAHTLAFDHVVAAVADHPSDPRGLWPADFDLLGRLSALARLDIVVTDEAHDAGFRDRIDRELPGIETMTHGRPSPPPALVTARRGTAVLCRMSRDREEELRDVARAIRAQSRGPDALTGPERTLVERTAIVYQRPLPYVYLVQAVLDDAGVPYRMFDALPLAAEPYAALLDLVLAFARTGGTREASSALLRSPLLRFSVDGARVGLRDVAALEAALVAQRATGEADTYGVAMGRGDRVRRSDRGASRAADAAAAARAELLPFRDAEAASDQVRALAAFLRRHERRPGADDPWGARHLRARAATLGALDALGDAYQRHDDDHRDPAALAATVHHCIERQTFAPRRGSVGVQLVDSVAARFGDFDHVHLVGLVDAEWPARPARNIFYTSGLLKELGWPSEQEHWRAEQAGFRDLLRLPARTLSLSAFQFEGDAVMAVSPMVEDARRLPIVVDVGVVGEPAARVFTDELMAVDPVVTDGLSAEAAAWLAERQARGSIRDARYQGEVGPLPPREYRVSQVDRFVQCPFKYFASYVLGVSEETEEEAGLSPRERGTLLHQLFERFYTEWQRDGRTAITSATLPEAVRAFEQIAIAALSTLPPADRALESTRLLGSAVGRGVAERVFQMECDAGRGVTRRFLEQSITQTFDFPAGFGPPRRIAVRGKADRIDVLDDGSLRVIDYKLSAAPKEKGAVQLPVYGYCAQQQLEAEDAAPHPVSAAYYVSFGDDQHTVHPLAPAAHVASAVEAGAAAFARHVASIEAGHFRPAPDSPKLCGWCEYALVCRKEVVDEAKSEDEDAAGSV
jgi:RecB family exonuclease